MSKKSVIMALFLLMATVYIGCDDMFGEWLENKSGSMDLDFEWKSVDPLNTSDPAYPVYTLNVNPYSYTYSPCLAVYNNTLYAAWIEDLFIKVMGYNGNDADPQWNLVAEYSVPGTGYDLVMYPSSFGLLLGYTDSGDVNIRSVEGAELGLGIQYAVGGNPTNINMVDMNGDLYVIWEQQGYARMKFYNHLSGTWDETAEDSYGYGINNSDLSVMRTNAAVYNGILYVVLIQDYNLKVRQYDGSWWMTYTDNMNYYNAGTMTVPDMNDILPYNDTIFVNWIENFSPDGSAFYSRLNVRSIDGFWMDNFTDSDNDGVPEINGGLRRGTDLTWYAYETVMLTVRDRLCVVWSEDIYDSESGSYTGALCASLFTGDKANPWTPIDGNETIGFYTSYNNTPSELKAVEYNGGIYTIFTDYSTGYSLVHVMAGR